mgnify:CR=1 FL=1
MRSNTSGPLTSSQLSPLILSNIVEPGHNDDMSSSIRLHYSMEHTCTHNSHQSDTAHTSLVRRTASAISTRSVTVRCMQSQDRYAAATNCLYTDTFSRFTLPPNPDQCFNVAQQSRCFQLLRALRARTHVHTMGRRPGLPLIGFSSPGLAGIKPLLAVAWLVSYLARLLTAPA